MAGVHNKQRRFLDNRERTIESLRLPRQLELGQRIENPYDSTLTLELKAWRGGYGLKSAGFVPMDPAWINASRVNTLAAIPAKHGSGRRHDAINDYDNAGLSAGPIQHTTHYLRLQGQLYKAAKLDPELHRVLAAEGYDFALQRFQRIYLTRNGEILDLVECREFSLVAIVQWAAARSPHLQAIQLEDLLRDYYETIRGFGFDVQTPEILRVLAFDIRCNKGLGGARSRWRDSRAHQAYQAGDHELAVRRFASAAGLSFGRLQYDCWTGPIEGLKVDLQQHEIADVGLDDDWGIFDPDGDPADLGPDDGEGLA